MKIFKKSVLGLIFTLILAFSLSLSYNFAMNVYALDTKISFSDPSVIEGNEVTVVLKITSIEGGNLGNADIMLKYDPTYLEFISGNNAEGGAGAIRISAGEDGKQEWVYNLRFKSLKAGDTNIEVNSDEIYDVDGKAATVSKKGSSKVTISPGVSTSNNANLNSLSIAEASLSPEFSADITEYNVIVSEDVEKLTISAASADANSTIEINGNENLVAGENKVNISVKAADGNTSKTYTITVTKAGTETNDTNLSTGASSSGAEIVVSGKSIQVLEPDSSIKVPETMLENDIEVNGVKVKGFVDITDAGQNFIVVYAQNTEGEKGFYVYDLKEKTIQRYFFEDASLALNNYNSLQESYNARMLLIYALALIILVLIIAIIYLLFRKTPKKDDEKEEVYLAGDYFDIEKNTSKDKEIFGQEIDLNEVGNFEIKELDLEEFRKEDSEESKLKKENEGAKEVLNKEVLNKQVKITDTIKDLDTFLEENLKEELKERLNKENNTKETSTVKEKIVDDLGLDDDFSLLEF